MKRLSFLPCALCIWAVCTLGFAQDRVVTAGQDGVAAPKRTRTVNPVYPQEALAQGIRGIVILEVLIDPQGKVTSAEIIRSIPGLDEAALEAVRKWEYEVTKVDGKPVSVKLTVPITFAMKVPEVTRAPGIPELRQGAAVQYPPGQTEGASVAAEVTLNPDGQVAEAEVLKGDAPWTAALLGALRTWRFASSGENVVLSFRVEAEFVPARGDKPRVNVHLTGLRRSETASTDPVEPSSAGPAPPPTVAPTASEEPESPAPGPDSPGVPPAPAPSAPTFTPSPPAVGTEGAAPTTPAPEPAPEAPPKAAPPAVAPAPQAPAPVTQAPVTPTANPGPVTQAPAPPTPAPARPDAPTSPEAKPDAAPPPVEVLSVPRPPGAETTPAPPAQPGVSALKDVALSLGVPDLVRGRRPVPPPLARMSGTTGSVEVRFGVDAAGITSISEASGPDVLKTAATYTVQSWLFRRVTAERLRLVAVFDYAGETAKAAVRPE